MEEAGPAINIVGGSLYMKTIAGRVDLFAKDFPGVEVRSDIWQNVQGESRDIYLSADPMV